MYLNGEGIEILHQPAAHTDGDAIVFFRRSDVVVAGDILDTTRFPVIDIAHGGSTRGGDGGTSGFYAEGMHGGGGESFTAAERGVAAQSERHAGVAERVADCRIAEKPGNVRGFSEVSRLMIDDAAQVDDLMYKALRPMPAGTGRDRGFSRNIWGVPG
jgi:hypothetical protein